MNLIEYLNQKGIVARQKNAGECCSPCPVCGGKDRFTFWPDKGRYFCRRCNKSGDLIDLLRNVDGLNYAEACECVGKPASQLGSVISAKKKQIIPAGELTFPVLAVPSELWRQRAAAFIEWAHSKLLKNAEQLAWLEKERGLSLATVKRFKLGWNDKDRYYSRPHWGLPEEKKPDGKLKILWLPCGLVIPCHCCNGQLLRLKIRRPDTDLNRFTDARYIFIPGSSAALAFFGEQAPAYLIVESELDAILLSQESAGMIAAVAIGSTLNKPDQTSFKTLSEAERVLISLDNDPAGEAAVEYWRGVFKNSRFWLVPRKYGKDHTEAMQHGLDLKLWLKCGIEANT